MTLSKQSALDLLHDSRTRKTLFPKYGWMMCDNYWRLAPNTMENLHIAVCQHNVLVSCKGNNVIEGLSFNAMSYVRHGVRLDLWYYGENEKALLAHMVTCLQRASTVLPPCMLYVMVHFPEHFDYDVVADGIKPILGQKFAQPPFDKIVVGGETFSEPPYDKLRLRGIATSRVPVYSKL